MPVHGKTTQGGRQVPGASARGRGAAEVQAAAADDWVFYRRSVSGELRFFCLVLGFPRVIEQGGLGSFLTNEKHVTKKREGLFENVT